MSTPEHTRQQRRQSGSPWSFKIATVAKIPIRLHFTFLLFVAWVALMGRATGDRMWPLLVLAIFFCVLLHELGHALTARRFLIPIRDITLYPIGGLALLQKQPRPRQELWITLAGPMVNVAIAMIVGTFLVFRDGHLPPVSLVVRTGDFWASLFAANVVLALFNLIPAFPMDGGRILRAALAMSMDEVRATQIAGTIGQGLAILFGFVGLFTQSILLMLVAFFVFLGAGQEVTQMVTRTMMSGHKIADAMITRYRTIQHGDTLAHAAQMLLEGSQHDFPVFAGEELIGLLSRQRIIEGLATEGGSAYVAAYTNREPKIAHPNVPLQRTIEMFASGDPSPVIVLDDGRLVGMLTQDNLNEFLMLEQAQSHSRTFGYTA